MANDSSSIGELVDALTLDEKVQLVHGAPDPKKKATGYIPGVERIDIPAFRLADGPLGVRVIGEAATAFPAPIALAATFDTELAQKHGAALGREAKALDQDALLGPGVNLIRVPHCGRNFEYYSEDPVLTASFARSVVSGIQSENVIATPKHYVANNQEVNRASVNVEISERALRECYLPGFKAAVEAGAGSVMTAYNRVNGGHISDNRFLVTDILKEEWGFDGYTVSDWFGVMSTLGAANAGLDLEMPGITRETMWAAWEANEDEGENQPVNVGDEGGPEDDSVFGENGDFQDGMPDPSNTRQFAEPLKEAVRSGELAEERLDEKVSRILGQMERVGALDGSRDEGSVGTTEHSNLTQTIAARGSVLLENDGILPLDDDADVAVIGSGIRDALLGGGGSSEMEALHEVPTVDGIRDRASGTVLVAQGIPEIEWPSFFDSHGNEKPSTEEPADATVDAAVEAATNADVAIVVVHDTATEAKDRETLRLPGRQDELVEAVAEANDDTVVIVQSSGPVEMPWSTKVRAILETWYPGQSDGAALASILYGDLDASGRLPVTFATESNYPTDDEKSYPGIDDTVHYDENLFIGYRHFDVTDSSPIYSFGHGLSYASFEYRSIEQLNETSIQVIVENTSDRGGREVVQAYVRPPKSASSDRPIREFAGFAPVSIPAGNTVTVKIDLAEIAFAQYRDDAGWVTADGTYTVEVGRSARDIRLETPLLIEERASSQR